MKYTLKNNDIEISVTTLGGTLCSIKDHDGLEYLWQGDKNFWSGQAPVLFPICGSIRDDTAVIGEEKHTSMPRHGIVRKREFHAEYLKVDEVAFYVDSNDKTRQAFPYDFRLHTCYKLLPKGIRISYIVENTGTQKMPFLIGGHPGFNCPLMEGESYEDYGIIFEKMEKCSIPTPVTESGLIDMEHRTAFFEDEDVLPLKHELFEKDAIIFDELKSRKVNLVSLKNNKGISLSFEQFPYLILWSSANRGNFIAIEPWMGLSTCSDEDDVFEHKRNMQFVEPGCKSTYSYEINLI